MGPRCDVLAAHHQCGSVFSAQFCPFQADTNFSHGSVAAQIWDAFSLPFLSPPLLLGIIFILPNSFDAVFWSEWGFSARPLLCHQLAAAFQGESLMVWCLCHPLYTYVRIMLGAGQQGDVLGKILQKRKYYCPTAFWVPEKKIVWPLRAAGLCPLTSFAALGRGKWDCHCSNFPSGVSRSSCVVLCCLASLTTCVTADFWAFVSAKRRRARLPAGTSSPGFALCVCG